MADGRLQGLKRELGILTAEGKRLKAELEHNRKERIKAVEVLRQEECRVFGHAWRDEKHFGWPVKCGRCWERQEPGKNTSAAKGSSALGDVSVTDLLNKMPVMKAVLGELSKDRPLLLRDILLP